MHGRNRGLSAAGGRWFLHVITNFIIVTYMFCFCIISQYNCITDPKNKLISIFSNSDILGMYGTHKSSPIASCSLKYKIFWEKLAPIFDDDDDMLPAPPCLDQRNRPPQPVPKHLIESQTKTTTSFKQQSTTKLESNWVMVPNFLDVWAWACSTVA